MGGGTIRGRGLWGAACPPYMNRIFYYLIGKSMSQLTSKSQTRVVMSRSPFPNINKVLPPKMFKDAGFSKKVCLTVISEHRRMKEIFDMLEHLLSDTVDYVRGDSEKMLKSKSMNSPEVKQRIEELTVEEKNESERKKQQKERKKAEEEQRKRKLDQETKEAEENDEDIEEAIKNKYGKGKISLDTLWQKVISPEGAKQREEKKEEMEEKKKIKSDIRKRNGESSDEDEEDDEDDESSSSSSSSRAGPKAPRPPSVTQLHHWISEASRKGDFVIDDNSIGVKIKDVVFDEITGKVKICLTK